MRRFIVQALVDERVVWDVMRYLESVRAGDILARPAADAAPKAKAPKPKAKAPKPNGAGRGTGRYDRPDSMQARTRAAIRLALAERSQITKKELFKALAGDSIKRGAVDAVFNKLTAAGALKRVAPATYVKGKKAAP